MFRVLVAEDDPSTQKLLCAILKMNGYETVAASDGQQALDLLDTTQVDLLLCDIMMPRLAGLELTRQLRESGSTLHILMVTAKAQRQDKDTGFLMGTDD